MNKITVLDLWEREIHNVDPVYFLSKPVQTASAAAIRRAEAFLFWGKTSPRFYEAVRKVRGNELARIPVLGIYPRGDRLPGAAKGTWIAGEHPLPGEGSFEAGRAVLEFFDFLRRKNIRRLAIFLSGGASSLAWLPNSKETMESLASRLERLYRQGLDIHELNQKRSELCQLKGGGAAKWLHRLAPGVRPKVWVLSDVDPNGPSVVGSGPFWNGKIPHRVWASNTTLVQSLARQARICGLRVLEASSGNLGTWENWMQIAKGKLRAALRENNPGVIILGGEPSVPLPKNSKGRGGRQTHLALALAHEMRTEFLDHRLEVLAMSTDGGDGNSGFAGAWLDSKRFPARLARIPDVRLRASMRRFDSGALIEELGAGVRRKVPSANSNVQDILMIRVLP